MLGNIFARKDNLQLQITLIKVTQKEIVRKWDYFQHWYYVPTFTSALSAEQGTNVNNMSGGIFVFFSSQSV